MIFFKRIFDLFFSILSLVFMMPLFIVIAILVKFDSKGSVFFVQKRLGKNGVPFGIYKFRSMVVGAERKGSGLDSYHDDPRVTKIGKILRDSSLDEIPQLINVLLGDMSFVGPRPPVTYSPYIYEEYSDHNKKRFLVKPGVTGLAQINGRNELSWDEKFQYDIKYVDNLNFFTDIKIILITMYKVFKNEGSYDKKKNEK